MKKHYGIGGTNYKDELAKQADRFGFTPDQVAAMNKPVLVRQLNADDSTAIRLGQYTFNDLESGGSQRINPITTAARIPHEDKLRMLDDIFRNAPEDSTLKDIIRNNKGVIKTHLDPYLTDTQKETLENTDKQFTPDAVKDISGVFKHFLFDKGDEHLPDMFEDMPHHVKEGITQSLPKIFSTPQEHSLVPEIQNAVIAATRYRKSGIEDFYSWERQPDMIAKTPAPIDYFTPAEIELTKKFLNAKTQKEVKDVFTHYAKVINGHSGDLFEPATEPQSKDAAVKEVFGVPHVQRRAAESAKTASPAEVNSGQGIGSSTTPDSETRDIVGRQDALRTSAETQRPTPQTVTKPANRGITSLPEKGTPTIDKNIDGYTVVGKAFDGAP